MKQAVTSFTSSIKKAISSVSDAIESFKEGAIQFVADARENGLKETSKKLWEKTKESFTENVLVHFKSKENFDALLHRIRNKYGIKQFADAMGRTVAFLKERISDYLYPKTP